MSTKSKIISKLDDYIWQKDVTVCGVVWLYLVMRLQPERLQLGVTIFLVGELVVLQNIVHLPEVA